YYDADGKRRIKVKTAGGAATEPDGQGGVRLVADRSFYFYEGEDLICQQDVGALVARIPGTDDIDESVYGPKFLLLDHLGSTRAELVFTESGGVFSPVIQEYYDLMPYGEVITPPSTQESVLFTGKFRDTESGLDYFGPRGFNPNLYRWLSPDQPFADSMTDNPQSWNLYAYCRGNPIVRIDITGFDIVELTKIVRQISSDLNQAYSSSFRLYQRRSGEIIPDSVEVGGNIVRTSKGKFTTRDIHDDNKRTEVSIRPDRIESGDALVGHFHTHRVEPGSTFSSSDIGNADEAGKYSILESGTKRFAMEITDIKAFTSFMKQNEGAILDALQKAQVKSKEDEVKVIANFANQKGSGFKLYQTVDDKKVKWEEVK
ncbi:MAG TPA: RHS repeat-associated core domain-containing protein, partial [Syntrophales bacterium]|nr:RHS repeat-associated core domain-containing protein [Syntrophales bacterium]